MISFKSSSSLLNSKKQKEIILNIILGLIQVSGDFCQIFSLRGSFVELSHAQKVYNSDLSLIARTFHLQLPGLSWNVA